jgi:hypothetical protein
MIVFHTIIPFKFCFFQFFIVRGHNSYYIILAFNIKVVVLENICNGVLSIFVVFY